MQGGWRDDPGGCGKRPPIVPPLSGEGLGVIFVAGQCVNTAPEGFVEVNDR